MAPPSSTYVEIHDSTVRKYFEFDDDALITSQTSCSVTEKAIASILLRNRHDPHVLLRVFSVTDRYYDAERLDLCHPNESSKARHVRECLNALHDINIIYIDIKEDNVGFSHVDQRWKLFDFDCSGISSPGHMSWINAPPLYHAYKLYVFRQTPRIGSAVPLTQIDDFLYERMFVDAPLNVL